MGESEPWWAEWKALVGEARSYEKRGTVVFPRPLKSHLLMAVDKALGELREELDHVSADLIDAVAERDSLASRLDGTRAGVGAVFDALEKVAGERDELRRQLAAIEAAGVERKRLLAGFDD